MESNSLIQNINLDKLNVDFDSSYYYWSDKNDLNKLNLIKENHNIDGEYYLPCIPFDTIKYNYNELIGKNILIFLKNPKIFYGLSKIELILIDEKNNLYNFDLDYEINNNLKNISNLDNLDNLVLVDSKKFQNLLNIFNLVNIYGLFFVKIDKIYIFDYEVNLNIFNKYFIEHKDFIEFKYPSKVKTKHITKSYYVDSKNFKSYLIKYLKDSERNYIKNKDIENEKEYSNINMNNGEKIKFCIPILWNGCNEFKKKFFKSGEDNSPHFLKKILLEHWDNCTECEIIDNNDKSSCITKDIFKNKKKILKYIGNQDSNFNDDNKIFKDIIYSYQNLDNFNYKNINNFEFDSDKINLVISLNEKDNPYNKCIFIINK